MKFTKTVIALIASTALVGCGTFSKSGSQRVSQAQEDSRKKLTTTFARQGVKVEWDCVHKTGIIWKTCEKHDVVSIEVTAYGVAFGVTETQRERAFKVAESKAKAKLAHFVREEVKTTNTINTLARNIEKAKNVSKVNTQGGLVVNLNDDDIKDQNYDSSESTTETAQNVADSVTTSSEMIMRGIRTVDEKIVDRRTVSVTIRWDQTGDGAATSLQRRFMP